MRTVRVTTKQKEREFEEDSLQCGKKVLRKKLVAYNYAGAGVGAARD